MQSPLSSEELKRLESFVSTTLADPGSCSHEDLVAEISENHSLCARLLKQAGPTESALSEADLNFLQSWLKARNLIIGGMELLKLADQQNAGAIQHEIDCTETALGLLPKLIDEARPR